MESPYRKLLQELLNREVTLHRAGASDIKGEVIKVGDFDGCVLKQPDGESCTTVFVAYSDIRGVAAVDWDYDVIS
ncbi:MAG TPA: hypothetical protein VFT82_01190 [Candidatus Paceibacterota bacterium]|nr:hypothetical protein [Candidatus Paceibacterota bacterium]